MLLILIGLFVEDRRRRIAVLFVLPTLSVTYIARYTVPPAPLIAAGAAVSAMSLVQVYRGMRAKATHSST